MAGFDPKFTMIAGQAVTLADLFNRAFSAGLAGPVLFAVELTTPVGPSTAGGKQALQHIRLTPTTSGPAIVIGSLNTKEQTAELRTFRLLSDNYAARFKGTGLPIAPEAYAALTKKMAEFLTVNGFMVTMMAVSASIPPPADRAESSGSGAVWVLLGLIVVTALGAGGYLMFMRGH